MENKIYNDFLEVATLRRTAKDYNPNKDVPEETMRKIYDFGLKAPHTMGLELVRHITFDRNSKFRKIAEDALSGFNRDRGVNSSHIAFLITKKSEWFNKENQALVDASMRVLDFGSKARGLDSTPQEMVDGFINTVADVTFGHNDNNGQEWSAKQAFIQIAYLVLGAKSLGVDTTIMEGFETSATDTFIKEGIIKEDERVSLAVLYGIVDEEVEHPFVGEKQLRVNLEDFWKQI